MDTPYKCSSNTMSTGFTPLMTLVMSTRQNQQLLNHLHDVMGDINQKNTEGWTALMYASRNSNTDSTEETVKMLIDAGADLNLQEKMVGRH